MIKLDKLQYRKLTDALRTAFDPFGLERMLQFRLGRDLRSEVGGDNHEQVVFNLIGKAQRTGWLHDLIIAAIDENSTTELREIAAELRPQINAATVDHFNVTFVDNNL
ncbi:MAG TPA: effector-associated domain EAD1-containing protein, partial [Pyrinomonadaceae bacterium]